MLKSVEDLCKYLENDPLVIRYKQLKKIFLTDEELIKRFNLYKHQRRVSILSSDNIEDIDPLLVEYFELHLTLNELAQDIAYFIQKEL
jgi:Fe-S-cluster formation regulator IscX/YfhJ